MTETRLDTQRPPRWRETAPEAKWFVRYGLWIVMLVVVTAWEVIGFVYPVGPTSGWYAHPTISQIVKHLEGKSLAGRVALSLALLTAFVTLILHWVVQVF